MKPSETSDHTSSEKTDEQQQKVTTGQDFVVEEDGRTNYYPKWDALIWTRSCEEEVINPLHGQKSGTIPEWLHGSLLRNGPGRIKVGDCYYNHVFDGSSLLHRFHFDKGEVTYQNRYLRSKSYLKDTEAQKIVVNYFGTRAEPDPNRSIFKSISSKFSIEEQFGDNAQISLYPYGDGLYALTETPFMFRVNPQTLETHQKVDITKYVAVFTHTSHPHVDDDGSVYNIGMGVGPTGPRYHVCKFPPGDNHSQGNKNPTFQKAKVIAAVPARWRMAPSYMHSFAMTTNYWVIIEQPLVVSVPKIIKVAINQTAFIESLEWKDNKTTLFHVVDRRTGEEVKTTFQTDTFFFMHTINAYEDQDHLVIDIQTNDNADMIDALYLDELDKASYDPTFADRFRSRPKRWVLPLNTKRPDNRDANLVTLPNTKCTAKWIGKHKLHLTGELLVDVGVELARIWYEKHNGRPYKYFYAFQTDVDHKPHPGMIIKVNVEDKTYVEWGIEDTTPSEPVFIPNPDAKDEDDGVVLTALLPKGNKKEILLVVLDAKEMKELGRVEYKTPSEVPKDLHGWFVQEGALMGRPLTGAALGAPGGSAGNTQGTKKKSKGTKSK